MATCVPCEAKELLNSLTHDQWEANHKLAKKVAKMHQKGQVDDEGAEAILGPIMKAERAWLDHGALALEKASQALAAALDLAGD